MHEAFIIPKDIIKQCLAPSEETTINKDRNDYTS